jgi:pyruvate dehydrogenase E1 component
MNLFLLLGMFGLSAELCGQLTLPIGTVYDPFVCRGLDALIYALYSGSKFIFAGTPSGVTLSPEGGAHQSTITPSIGAELPNLRMYEPCFAREVEWILLDSLRECFDRAQGRATYLRLSTRPIDQRLMEPALQRLGEAQLRQQTLMGGYRLRDWREGGPDVDARVTGCISPPPASCSPKHVRRWKRCGRRAWPPTYSTSLARAVCLRRGARMAQRNVPLTCSVGSSLRRNVPRPL